MTDRELLYDLLEIALTNVKVDWGSHPAQDEFDFLAKKIETHLKNNKLDTEDSEENEDY